MAIDLNSLIDINLLGYFKAKLDLIFANKVDKIDGKGLSSNDYTSNEKTKLANIATAAQVNVIEGIQISGANVSPVNKIVNIPAATQSANGIMSSADKTKLDGIETGAQANVVTDVSINGSGSSQRITVSKGNTNFTTYSEAAITTSLNSKADSSSVYTKTEVDQMMVGAMNYKGTKDTVSALPVSGNSVGDVWHITGDGSEWAWNGSSWDELGTAIDLSGYVSEDEVGLATTSDIDDLFT